jgi:hypothetical protein
MRSRIRTASSHGASERRKSCQSPDLAVGNHIPVLAVHIFRDPDRGGADAFDRGDTSHGVFWRAAATASFI